MAPHPSPTPDSGRGPAFLAGLAAAAVGLAVGELVSGLSGAVASPLTAMGDAVIELSPDRLVLAAISVLQRLGKPVLIGGIIVCTLAAGLLVGGIAASSRIAATVGVGLGGLLYTLALVRNPLLPAALAVATTLVATGAAASTLLLLHRRPGFAPARAVPSQGAATAATLERRRVLRLSGVALLAALATGGLGRSLSLRRAVSGAAQAPVLPRARQPLSPLSPAVELPVRGISPFLTPNERFYRVDVALTIPRIDLDEWRLRVTGMVDRPLVLGYDDLLALPLVESDATLCCVSNEVGGDLVGTARWTGVPLEDLLGAARVRPEATQVVGRSVDGWTGGFRTEPAFEAGALVAVGMNGEPLPPVHGFPARLIVPGLYGYVSATKWLGEIELTTWETFDGYWVERGWGKEGSIEMQARIDVPGWGATVPAGLVEVAGVAWAPPAGVAAVEVQVDDEPWAPARLGDEASPYAWRHWAFGWDAAPGRHFLQVRATDRESRTQTAEVRRPEPDGATGHHGVRVEVE